MNTKQLGTIGELKAQYDFMKAGFDISIPVGDYCAYDLIAIKDSKILKIQVKSCEKIIDGRIKFDLTSRNYYIDKKYDIQDCDYFYFYCLENEQSYLYKNTENNNSFYLKLLLAIHQLQPPFCKASTKACKSHSKVRLPQMATAPESRLL